MGMAWSLLWKIWKFKLRVNKFNEAFSYYKELSESQEKDSIIISKPF